MRATVSRTAPRWRSGTRCSPASRPAEPIGKTNLRFFCCQKCTVRTRQAPLGTAGGGKGCLSVARETARSHGEVAASLGGTGRYPFFRTACLYQNGTQVFEYPFLHLLCGFRTLACNSFGDYLLCA